MSNIGKKRTGFCNFSIPDKFERSDFCENFNAMDTIVDSSKDIFIKQSDPIDDRTVDAMEYPQGTTINPGERIGSLFKKINSWVLFIGDSLTTEYSDINTAISSIVLNKAGKNECIYPENAFGTEDIKSKYSDSVANISKSGVYKTHKTTLYSAGATASTDERGSFFMTLLKSSTSYDGKYKISNPLKTNFSGFLISRHNQSFDDSYFHAGAFEDLSFTYIATGYSMSVDIIKRRGLCMIRITGSLKSWTAGTTYTLCEGSSVPARLRPHIAVKKHVNFNSYFYNFGLLTIGVDGSVTIKMAYNTPSSMSSSDKTVTIQESYVSSKNL